MSGAAHYQVVDFLIGAGADIEVTDIHGKTDLMYACTNTITERSAASFMKSGAAINKQDRGGWTALMYACSSANVEAVRLLVTQGADTSIKDYTGQNGLQIVESRLRADSGAFSKFQEVRCLKIIRTLLKESAPQ